MTASHALSQLSYSPLRHLNLASSPGLRNEKSRFFHRAVGA